MWYETSIYLWLTSISLYLLTWICIFNQESLKTSKIIRHIKK
ncbi:hypothetical protein HanXRQr2_Chr16g0746161 [Helianthus annuus]|uniref:Uncharacterized protein n=1 Tax=Helianthus annuus TaxID=4232 RepID=A0A9K3DT84_HELAN|nr:hypothetical protein HanXRQr2_Chr16g0746161 [Helianthus annuus]